MKDSHQRHHNIAYKYAIQMLIDIAVVPTFSQEATLPKAPFTLRGIDATSTTVQALCDAVYAHLTTATAGDTTNSACSEQAQRAYVTISMSGVNLCLTTDGVVLTSSDATTVLADLQSVASTIDAHARRPVLPNRTSRPRPPSRPLITVHVTEQPQPYLIRIVVKVDHKAEEFSVFGSPMANVKDLWRYCVSRSGIPDEELMMLNSPKRDDTFSFEAHQTLAQCGLADSAVLYLDERSRKPLPLPLFYVKSLVGTTIELRLARDARIEDVKEALVPSTNLPPDAMRLVFAGKQLEEGRTLTCYNISPGSVLHLIQRLRGNGHCGIPSYDDALFVMSFSLHDMLSFVDPPGGQSYARVVRVVDTVGMIPFVQKGDEITLARPCLGAPHVSFFRTHPEPVMNSDTGEVEVEVCDSSTPTLQQVRAIRSVPLELRTPGGRQPTRKAVGDGYFDFEDCHTGADLLQTLFAQVAQQLPLPIKERGFDLYIVRPSGAEVLLNGIAPLLSPLNARRILIVRPVAEGTQPAFAYDRQDDVSSSDSSSDEHLAECV